MKGLVGAELLTYPVLSHILGKAVYPTLREGSLTLSGHLRGLDMQVTAVPRLAVPSEHVEGAPSDWDLSLVLESSPAFHVASESASLGGKGNDHGLLCRCFPSPLHPAPHSLGDGFPLGREAP